MLNVGTPELLVILLVALLVLGPTKLPEAARQVGRAVAELRRLSSGFQAELRDAMEAPTVERSPTPLATPAPDPAADAPAADAEETAQVARRPRRERPLAATKATARRGPTPKKRA